MFRPFLRSSVTSITSPSSNSTCGQLMNVDQCWWDWVYIQMGLYCIQASIQVCVMCNELLGNTYRVLRNGWFVVVEYVCNDTPVEIPISGPLAVNSRPQHLVCGQDSLWFAGKLSFRLLFWCWLLFWVYLWLLFWVWLWFLVCSWLWFCNLVWNWLWFWSWLWCCSWLLDLDLDWVLVLV